ncbi:MAG: hypothetical protein VSS52_000275 [Thiotrichaceae bacterium]|nr:hypothetical protein [Thiotrichaceae bacterium]
MTEEKLEKFVSENGFVVSFPNNSERSASIEADRFFNILEREAKAQNMPLPANLCRTQNEAQDLGSIVTIALASPELVTLLEYVVAPSIQKYFYKTEQSEIECIFSEQRKIIIRTQDTQAIPDIVKLLMSKE